LAERPAMTFGLLFLALMSVTPSRAEVALPTVAVSDFTVGRSWTWDYTQADGKPWSTERYTVIAVSGTTVFLEISSDYGGGQNLKPNTRLQVDIQNCLAAYANPAQKKPWSYKMFFFSSGHWNEFEAPNTLAFEEKFNCNPREYLGASDPYLTVYSEIDGVPVFQQKLWRRLSASWFAQDGSQKGVAVQKEFTSDPTMTYVFKLRNFAK